MALFAPSNSKSGHGRIALTLLSGGVPSFNELVYSYPLKLVPSTPYQLPPLPKSEADTCNIPRASQVPLVFLLSYGGGLLPPDTLSVHITLAPGTRLALATQGSTKLFAVPASHSTAIATQTLQAYLAPHTALWLAPDAVQPFARARGQQRQVFEVAVGASLGLVDWVTQGRGARGERWDGAWRGVNEIWRAGVLVVRDAVIMEGETLRARMEDMGVWGTVILVGPVLEELKAFFLAEFSSVPRVGGRDWGDEKAAPVDRRTKWRTARRKAEEQDGLLWSVARVRGCVVVKFAARDMAGAKSWLGGMLSEEGTIGREFGDGGLLCLR